MKRRRARAPLLLAALALGTVWASSMRQAAAAGPAKVDPDPWFGRDKAMHFGACAGISMVSYGLTALASNDVRMRFIFGAGAGIAAGGGKELLDMTGSGDPSWRDFAWDVAGTVVGVGIAITIDLAVRGFHAKPVH